MKTRLGGAERARGLVVAKAALRTVDGRDGRLRGAR